MVPRPKNAETNVGQVRPTRPPNHQELPAARNRRFVGMDDVLLGHRCSPLWHLHHRAIPQHPAPTTATTIHVVGAYYMGAMYVLRQTLVVEKLPSSHRLDLYRFRRD
jgi:hypothetical protein